MSDVSRLAVALIVSSFLLVPIARAQLVENGTFDSGLSHWNPVYSLWSTLDASGFFGASGSIEVSNGLGAGFLAEGPTYCVPYIPSSGIWVSGKIYIPPGQGPGYGYIYVSFLRTQDCGGGFLGQSATIGGGTTQSGTWVQVSGSIPRPSGARSAQIRLPVAKEGEDLFQVNFDDIQFRSATGDFNVDGLTDIVLRNSTTGAIGMWLMNGSTITSGAFVGSPGGSYTIAGIGDFDGDGHSDLLLRDGSGNLGMWFMNGSTIGSGAFVGSPGGSYTVAGIGDFDADGKSDILLRDSLGNLGMWLMNGSTISSGAFVGSPGGSYTVVGVADFGYDDKADILLRDSGGNLGLWTMNGPVITYGDFVGSPGGSYSVAGLGDFNGDRKADILLRDASGNLGMWFMSLNTVTSGAFVGLAGGYNVAAVGDYNGDAKADILLRNTSSGEVGLWTMNGATITSTSSVGPLPAAYTVAR